ncbi:hypothetical protein UUR2_0622 [Ureaplasma urealyticum serovar 2 str. ATCC 27814]|nr:hypothetical protein UUR2_0622 [Ureaplasma urealyticum serovar 2 str. ATCC 27814]
MKLYYMTQFKSNLNMELSAFINSFVLMRKCYNNKIMLT